MKQLLAVFSFLTLFAASGYSQSNGYWSSGGEMLFSFADINDQGIDEGSTLRWAPVFNIQGRYNYDLNKNIGLFTGIGVRNVGYIYNNYQERTNDGSEGNWYKKKFRTYNIGLPLAIKLGNMDGLLFYGGYEIEVPFVYKEKTFDQGDKIDKITGWFSDRSQMFMHGFIAGVEFPYGFNVKFKYYMSEFHNQNFTQNDGIKPYSGLESHIMYFSVGYNLSWD